MSAVGLAIVSPFERNMLGGADACEISNLKIVCGVRVEQV
jgi:hypothetical protein